MLGGIDTRSSTCRSTVDQAITTFVTDVGWNGRREQLGHRAHQCWGAESLVDDLALGRGVVISRAAALLRSIETQPYRPVIRPRSLWTVVGLNSCWKNEK